METAAALLAGGIVFFAGFCLGLYPPAGGKKRVGAKNLFSATQDKYFENFLNYDGEVQP